MFRSAVWKLTGWYVAALVIVCALFSIPAYSVGAARLKQGASRQFEALSHSAYATRIPIDELLKNREEMLDRDRQALLNELLLVDVMIVGLGSVLGYRFARRTLKPIEQAHINQVRFTADASHELRTPLAVLQTEIDVALRNKTLSLSQAKDVLESNLEEISRMRLLSDQLLSLTRIDNGQITTRLEDLSKLVRREISTLEKRYNISVSKRITPGITAKISSELIGQLLAILVDNSVKYKGGSEPEISIEMVLSDKQIVLTIADNGIGIAPDDIDHIFERFRQGKRRGKGIRGHGLGLALAKDIVVAHKGSISVNSVPGEGASFKIRLPASG